MRQIIEVYYNKQNNSNYKKNLKREIHSMILQAEESQQQNKVSTQIRNFISQILNFGVSQQASKHLIEVLLNSNLGKFTHVKLWNKCLLIQIKSFIGRIKFFLRNQNTKAQAHRKNAIQKIKESSAIYSSVIEKLIEIQHWCMCERRNCPSKFQPQHMKRKIMQFYAIQLIQQSSKQQITSFKDYSPNFLGIENDMQCCVLSIENVQKKSQQKQNQMKKQIKQSNPQNLQNILQFLKELKFNKNQRKNCYFDVQRIENFYMKFNIKRILL